LLSASKKVRVRLKQEQLRILTKNFKCRAESSFGKTMIEFSNRLVTNYFISLVSAKTGVGFRIVAMLFACVPVIAVFIEYDVRGYSYYDSSKIMTLVWAVYFGLFNWLIFMFNRCAWNKYIKMSDQLSLMLGRQEQNIIINKLYQDTGPVRQIVFGVFSGGGFFSCMWQQTNYLVM